MACIDSPTDQSTIETASRRSYLRLAAASNYLLIALIINTHAVLDTI